jgi:hypothetical protein
MPDIKILLEGILHGDDEHRDWLEEAVYAWAEGKSIPEPRGSGTKDRLYKEIETLKLKLEENGIRI